VIQVIQMSDVPAESADNPAHTAPWELTDDLAREAASTDSGRGVGALVTGVDLTPKDLDPSDPAFHWHSIVRARGWAQPTLDGSNGGQDPAAWLWRHPHLHENPAHPSPALDRRDGRRR
jgi:hypothetical protein